MRILMTNNSYQQAGGEDSVVASEIDLLQKHGNEVQLYSRHNREIDGISRLSLVTQTMWSARTRKDLRAVVRRFRPHVIHAHNTFPLISPSLYWEAEALHIPVVQTLHNFRLICPGATLLRHGLICEDCVGRLPWPGAWHGCYRTSRAQSTVVAGMLIVHRLLNTWDAKVTRYVALNRFCREKFIQAGLPADRIVVKPNFVPSAAPVRGRRSGFLFVGRLVHEKGIRVLASALRKSPGLPIRVAGTGPDTVCLRNLEGCELLGSLLPDEVRKEMSTTVALVLPSIWYENSPRVLVEALACGLPVVASRIGALAEIIRDGTHGLLFTPNDPTELAAKLDWARNNPDDMLRMGRNARALYEAEFDPDRNYEQLMRIYQEAILECAQEAHA